MKSNKKLHIFLFLLFNYLSSNNLFAIESISIITNESNLNNSVSSKTINDFKELLKKACNCKVALNEQKAEILIILPEIDSLNFPLQNNSLFEYPVQNYSWNSKYGSSQIELKLQAVSYQGISFGLYGLLQEKLGFQFYHPKQTFIPEIKNWPLSEHFEWKVDARFNKRGFHLHTMHPIELTEALLNIKFQNGLEEIKTYIDWLARNQQNYFEFNLLESINRKKWIPYIKEAVDYGKSRGIIMGVDISLHMVQQKAFMLYRNFPASFLSRKKQVEKNINWLSQAGFDVYSVEFSTTEFSSGNIRRKKKLQLYLGELIEKKGAKLFGREHVVQKDKLLKGKKQQELILSESEKLIDSKRGLLVHSVMFYNISERKAPVYKNTNLRHMLETFKKEVKARECWYYPESAYWITFDNSVPMTLLPYLNARLDDIVLMDSLGAEGHLTFSSGWEWGYWLTDWSIARWSWSQQFNGKNQENHPLQYINALQPDNNTFKVMNQLLELQQEFIKEKELIRYLAPLSFADELPAFLNLEFQPRPLYSNKYLSQKAMPYQLDTLKKNVIEPLLQYAERSEALLLEIKADNYKNAEMEEFINGLEITALRAKHKAQILNFYVEKREASINKTTFSDANTRLANAAKIREQALKIVKIQEKLYRYPNKILSEKYKSKSAYNFGYLYTVSNLHYWKREEEQALKKKYGPFFMNIMDVWRIIGLKN
jgi:hypothetical protein